MPEAQYGNSYTVATRTRFVDCFVCSASIPVDKVTFHSNFHKTFSNRVGDDMSRVSWCDYGDHDFKRGVAGSATFSGTEVDENGITHDTQMDACPLHNPLNVQRQAAQYQLTPKAYEELSKPLYVEPTEQHRYED